MRILSPFHDYYDSAQSFGSDQTRLFLRKPEIIAAQQSQLPRELVSTFDKTHVWSNSNWSAARIGVVFCGELYYALRLTFSTYAPRTYLHISDSAVFYSAESAQAWAAAKGQPAMLAFLEKRIKAGTLHAGLQAQVPNQEWLIEHNAPILVCDPHAYGAYLTRNARLDELEFYKVFNAVQTYQELDMYLSGVLAAENKPMVEISDKIRVLQHGFDCRSFRKDPTKRKVKACAKAKP